MIPVAGIVVFIGWCLLAWFWIWLDPRMRADPPKGKDKDRN